MVYFRPLLLTSVLFSSHIIADASQSRIGPEDGPHPHRVAIIGGGAAGSSAAYYLRKFSDGLPLEITVFDKNARVGGRTTTVDALDDPRYPIELGASIFVKLNEILYNATRDFGLQPRTNIYESNPNTDFSLGVWDGYKFVFNQGNDKGQSWRDWLNLVKLLIKYGLSPVRTQYAMKDAVGRFLRFYNEPIFPFHSLQHAVEAVSLISYTAKTGIEVLLEAKVSEQFSHDIVQASTRVNYGQNLNGIHGLETLVCMATDDAMAVSGGNFQIFDEFIKRSNADVELNTTVTGVSKVDGKYRIRTSSGTSKDVMFDEVILAAPYQFANVAFSPKLAHVPLKVNYVSIHVTLFATPYLLSPTYFNLTKQSEVPSSILTTIPGDLTDLPDPSRIANLTGLAGFWSISTLQSIHPDSKEGPIQYVYKIFSLRPLTATFLSDLFGFPHIPSDAEDSVSAIPKNHMTWFHEKQWFSYPYLPPIQKFERLRLDTDEKGQEIGHCHFESGASGLKQPDCDVSSDSQAATAVLAERMSLRKTDSVAPAGGIWYTSGIEQFISTMETSALMGRNIAKLIANRMKEQ